MNLPKRDWMEMTWQEVAGAGAATARWIAVLPLAAVEQHGPHLPLGVDTFIAEAYLARVREILPDELPVSFLPVQRIGVSVEHLAYPGTLTLSAATAIAAWTELGESLARAGVRKLVLVTSHGGNVAAMELVARELRARLGMLAVTVGWHRFGYPDGAFSRRGEAARHPRRRHRDLADAGGEAGNGAHGQGAQRHAGDHRDGARVQMARRLSAGGLRLDDARSPSERRDRRCDAGERREGRSGARARRAGFVELLREVDRFDLTCARRCLNKEMAQVIVTDVRKGINWPVSQIACRNNPVTKETKWMLRPQIIANRKIGHADRS